MSSSTDQAAAQLQSAAQGFDFLFANEIADARKIFEAGIDGGQDSPFHLLGLGVLTFLEAALGMEAGLMVDASHCLSLAEAGAKKQIKNAKSCKSSHRFQSGIEWEILHADAVVLLGLTHALSESYLGYMQCMYALNSAHSKFSKLYKNVFPSGLDAYATPSATPSPSRKPSSPSLRSDSTSSSNSLLEKKSSSFFGRWGSSLTVTKPARTESVSTATDGPVEELIVAGTAFGFGLFNLVFSLLPVKIRSLVGFFGFEHDRKLALQALAVSAAKTDVHSIFAGLVLMSYHGVVLLLSGYQADEAHIIKQYRAIVDRIEPRYPTGALWILNRAKIMRMSHDAKGAIKVLQEGLKPARPHTFAQADTLLAFELAWTFLSQRRYQEAADMFMKMTELNSWSHATYYFIAAGCYISLGDTPKAQELFDTIPSLLDKRKINGKDLPTEVLIRKKLAFYKKKQVKRGGKEAEYAKVIKISPAEEIATFWNTHTRIEKSIAEAHIAEWSSLSPQVATAPPYITPCPSPPAENAIDLDTADELALRSLLLGLVHRTAGSFSASRAFLADAHKRQPKIEVSTWIGGVALFELAVLDLKECASEDGGGDGKAWEKALADAGEKLDRALALANSVNAELSSRLDSRIAMLRDEIATKREMLASGQ